MTTRPPCEKCDQLRKLLAEAVAWLRALGAESGGVDAIEAAADRPTENRLCIQLLDIKRCFDRRGGLDENCIGGELGGISCPFLARCRTLTDAKENQTDE